MASDKRRLSRRFIGTNDETLSIAAMRVNNPDCSPFAIHSCNTASTHVEQSILGRLWDYGTIVISGTGGSKQAFRRIAFPMEFRRAVQKEIAANAARS